VLGLGVVDVVVDDVRGDIAVAVIDFVVSNIGIVRSKRMMMLDKDNNIIIILIGTTPASRCELLLGVNAVGSGFFPSY
jgi:hypothetical protein